MGQEDSVLIEYIRNHLWIPATPRTVPYALYKPNQVDFTEGQWPAIKDVFENQVGLSDNKNVGMRTFGFSNCSFARYFS